MRERLLALALEDAGAVVAGTRLRFTGQEKYFVSEASVYRLLRAHELITSPAFIVGEGRRGIRREGDGAEPAPQTDFTYLYLSTERRRLPSALARSPTG